MLNAQVSIVPAPMKQVVGKGNFVLNSKTVIAINDEGERRSANFLQSYLKEFYGLNLVIGKRPASNYIFLNTLRFIRKPDNEGHYQLNVTQQSVEITGDSYNANFYGIQTLIQLLPVTKQKQLNVPVVSINDQPRFNWRGLHLDVARHFFPVEFLKKYIDFIALHKMNTFHWHLTDDQGWRVEIKKYPNLITKGAWRNGTIIGRYPGTGNDSILYGGYYTQEEIKEVVQYASERFITVIPEIEMPGHASAAIAAYPYLSCFPEESTKISERTPWAGPRTGKQVQQTWGVFEDVFCAGREETFKFLQDVIDEIVPLFPAAYIHIGGDECPKANWKRCPDCQKRIQQNNLKDEHELQSYLIQRMEKYINAKGKKIIGWDEILEGGLAPNATVMSWRGEQGGIEAAQQKHDVVMTPGNYVYLDHSQTKNEDSVTIGGFTPLEETYSYDPVPKELKPEESKYILGAQGNMWTEYMANPAKVEYQLMPRLAALSELLWSPKENKNWGSFESRVLQQFKRYDLWNVNYSRAYFELKDTVYVSPAFNGINWKLQSKNNGKISFGYGNEPKKTLTYSKPIFITKDTTISAAVISKDKKTKWITRRFDFNKATAKKITLANQPASNYPGNVGAFGLVNGMKAEKFNSVEWLGFKGQPLDAIIDLGKFQTISSVSLHTWKQEGSWIYLPQYVEVFSSNNGKDWTSISKAESVNNVWPNERTITLIINATAKYIRVVAGNMEKIPLGKQGAGNPAWLFVDEIEIQ
jgi:hexosaminidase